MIAELVTAIRDRQAILFVGSGASKGLGAPTWGELISEIGTQLGYEPDVFASLNANYLTVAEYYRTKMKGIGNLRSWMDRKWTLEDSVLKDSRVHQLMIDLGFPIIYTTNYDRFIEDSFRIRGLDYHTIIRLSDLTGSYSGTQIVKFHGDFSEDSSLVIAESDYFDRLSFESPLDIRLRSDVLGRSILFIGYSLTDINVRLMLYKMSKMWGTYGKAGDQPKSYLFLPKPDDIQKEVLENWGVQTIIGEVDDPNEALCAFLENLKSEVAAI